MIAVVRANINQKVGKYLSVRSLPVMEMPHMLWKGMSGQQKFKVNTFHVIIDQMKSAPQKHTKAYFMVLQRFGVLTGYDYV